MPTRLFDPAARGGDRYAALPCARCPGKHTNLCQPLADQLQAEFFDIGLRQRWMPREVLFRAGDEAGPIFKITKGVVVVSRSLAGGQRQVLRILLPGDVCGYLLENGRYEFDGEAVTEVVTCTFPRDSFESFEAANASFGEAVRVELSKALKEVGRHMTSIGQLPAPARVASFLLHMQQVFEARGMGGDALHLPMTRTDIADYLGLRVETVSRAFTAMGRRKLIVVQGEKVSIVDPHGLAGLAGGSGPRRKY